MNQVIQGDCLDVMRGMADCSVDAVVTDPPYGLSQHSTAEVQACLLAWCQGKPYTPKGSGFMGKSWDSWVPGPEVWREVLRVLKPGGHALVFAGTRSMDLMCMALRLAGFELGWKLTSWQERFTTTRVGNVPPLLRLCTATPPDAGPLI
jgi:site-specific DNA-methyltransferase (adenine-specific)